MERSGTSEEEYCSVLPQLSTITAVKHDREIEVVSARHNCSHKVCRRMRHCGSRGENVGQASLARSPHPPYVPA